MRRDHVEMTLVDGDVDRLADGSAGMMQPWNGIGELHEGLEIGQRSVAASAREILNERRPVGGREHYGVAADPERARRVARMLDKGARRGLENGPQESNGEAHALALNVGFASRQSLQRRLCRRGNPRRPPPE